MNVTDIKTLLLKGPRSHCPGGGEGEVTRLIVRVDTDSGLYGLGECQDFPGVAEAISYIRAILMGRDPLDIRPIVSN